MILLKKIEEHCASSQNLIDQMRFHNVKKNFIETYGNKPQLFVKTVREMLDDEQKLLASRRMNSVSVESNNNPYVDQNTSNNQQPFTDISKGLEELRKQVAELDARVKDFKNTQETVMLKLHEVSAIDEELKNLHMQSQTNPAQATLIQPMILAKQKSKVEIDQKFNEWVNKLHTDCEKRVLQHLLMLQQFITQASMAVYGELFGWKALQQKALSGGPKPASLHEIQTWFEEFFDIVWQYYSFVNQCKSLFEVMKISYAIQQIDMLMKDAVEKIYGLISKSFLVEKQPPQVLKTQTKFQASVRLLVGSKLSIQMTCPEVVVSILSEKQCKDYIKAQKENQQFKVEDPNNNSGEIVNYKCFMELNNDRRTFQAEFKNMQLKKIKRQDRKGQESVLEAKSALLFHAKINLSGQEITVVSMSVPVVVVVHGNQGPNSEATILWDNMFSLPDREPFDVPEEVGWTEMKMALNSRWIMTTEYPLHPEHLQYLKEKLFSNNQQESHKENPKVPWSLFNKEHIAGRSFTFWEWFYGAIDVVKKHLKEEWNDSCLEFMSRQVAHNKLLEKPHGTFLIRFSDGDPGAVTIAWCYETFESKQILFIQPWKSKDFSIRLLADRIFDLPELLYLYPDIPKETAFGRFKREEIAPTVNDSVGYVQAGIIAKLNISGPSLSSPLPSPAGSHMNQMMPSPSISTYSGMMNDPGSIATSDFMGSTGTEYMDQSGPNLGQMSPEQLNSILSSPEFSGILQQNHILHPQFSNAFTSTNSPMSNYAASLLDNRSSQYQ